MKNILTLFLSFLVISTAFGQNNLLLLKKKQKTIHTFYAGKFISIETVNDSYADGLITRITNDSIYIRHFEIEKSVTLYVGVYFDTAFRYTTVIHVKEIGGVVFVKGLNRKRNGTIMMVAGGGVMVLGAVNGLYRGDPPKDWYKPSAYILSAAMLTTGYFWSKSAIKKYRIGKKYQLKILPLSTR